MGSSSSTCVFNDSGSEIEILCPVRKLKLQAIELGAKAKAGASTKEGISGTLINSSKLTFAKDERVCFLRLPNKDFGKIKGGGRLLLTVISRCGSEDEEICINYPVPRNKALSVLRKTVKLETYNSETKKKWQKIIKEKAGNYVDVANPACSPMQRNETSRSD